MSKVSEMDDNGLMVLVQQGDHRAFSILVRRHTQKFFNLAFRTLHNEADAQDIVQACFVKLWQTPSIWSDDKGAKFTTWFYRVVLNACEDLRRKNTVRAYTNIDDMTGLSDAQKLQEEHMVAAQKKTDLERAISFLPDRQKEALNLVFYQELKQKDAANIMGVGLKALESLLSRAKAGVRDALAHNKALQNDKQNKAIGGRYARSK